MIASHVVEHTPDPEGFMAEVFRVCGGRGHLEFPLPTHEYFFDFDALLIYVWFDLADEALQFVRKPRPVLNEFLLSPPNFGVAWSLTGMTSFAKTCRFC